MGETQRKSKDSAVIVNVLKIATSCYFWTHFRTVSVEYGGPG